MNKRKEITDGIVGRPVNLRETKKRTFIKSYGVAAPEKIAAYRKLILNEEKNNSECACSKRPYASTFYCDIHKKMRYASTPGLSRRMARPCKIVGTAFEANNGIAKYCIGYKQIDVGEKVYTRAVLLDGKTEVFFDEINRRYWAKIPLEEWKHGKMDPIEVKFIMYDSEKKRWHKESPLVFENYSPPWGKPGAYDLWMELPSLK
jgi:hypothetical protein